MSADSTVPPGPAIWYYFPIVCALIALSVVVGVATYRVGVESEKFPTLKRTFVALVLLTILLGGGTLFVIAAWAHTGCMGPNDPNSIGGVCG